MKKLLIVAAATLCAAVMADGIESANTVGYSDADFTGKTMVCVGTPFFAVGDGAKFTLSNFAAEGFELGSDILQTIDPETADTVDSFVYLDPENYPTMSGWWYDDWSESADDIEFDAGQGFLGAFGGMGVTLRNAGEVSSAPKTFDYSGQTMVVVPNPLPRIATLSEITAEGFELGSDILQTIDPETADTIDSFVYLDPENYPTMAGWWYDDWSESADDVEINPGDGLLGAFGSGNVSLTFPSAL